MLEILSVDLTLQLVLWYTSGADSMFLAVRYCWVEAIFTQQNKSLV